MKLTALNPAKWEVQRRRGQRAFTLPLILAGWGCAATGLICQAILLHHVHASFGRLLSVGLPAGLTLSMFAMPLVCWLVAPLEWRLREEKYRHELAKVGRSVEKTA